MLTLRKVAITGGIASGKTAACQFFRELGAKVISADSCVHEILSSDRALQEKIVQLLGDEILSNGKIDRRKVAEKIFKNEKLLESIEALIHPIVFQQIENEYQKAKKEKRVSLFIAEIPLLFECHAESNYDASIAVVTDESIAKQRWASQGHPIEEYELRMKRQLSPKEKGAKATYILTNNGSFLELQSQVIRLNKTLQPT